MINTLIFVFAVLLVSVFRLGWKCYESTARSSEGIWGWMFSVFIDAVLAGVALWLITGSFP